MAQWPEWAEAANKLATVEYLLGELAASAAHCRRVLELKPWHFGALSGAAAAAGNGGGQQQWWPAAVAAGSSSSGGSSRSGQQ